MSDYIDRLDDQVRELMAWCDSRIATCREQEQRFGACGQHGKRASSGAPPRALVEAWAERQILQAVLRLLGRSDAEPGAMEKAEPSGGTER